MFSDLIFSKWNFAVILIWNWFWGTETSSTFCSWYVCTCIPLSSCQALMKDGDGAGIHRPDFMSRSAQSESDQLLFVFMFSLDVPVSLHWAEPQRYHQLLSCQPIGRPSPTHGRSRPRLRTGASVAARDARRGKWQRRRRQAAMKLCDRDAGTAAEPPAAPSSRLTCCRSEQLHWNLPGKQICYIIC